MKITYVSHACLHVETGDATIAFDPWFEGPAHAGQWNVFPRPVDQAIVDTAAHIVVSHGHEDHLHGPTLESLARKKTLVYPYYWYGETFEYLKGLGFERTIEALSGRRYALGPRTFLTAIVNGQDAILVVEADGEVLVNVNDALHSSDVRLIELYTAMIRGRWPRIDAVFCGFGGASFFPNVFHCPGKDDAAVAALREQLYAHNFCRIVQRLAPDIAVPFAADFVLLDPRQRWINEARFPRERIPEYYARHFAAGGRPRIVPMYPGDRLVDKRVELMPRPGVKSADGIRDSAVRGQYPDEISAFTHPPACDLPLDTIAPALRAHLEREARFFSAAALDGLRFAIRLRDLADEPWLNVAFRAREPRVTRSAHPDRAAAVRVDTMASILMNAVTTDWGGDALVIGYACEIEILGPAEASRARTCAELLTRYPRPRTYARRHPWRTFRYGMHSLPAVAQRLGIRLRRAIGRDAATAGSKSAGRSHCWLTGDLEAIRAASGLPEWSITPAGGPPPPAEASPAPPRHRESGVATSRS